MAVTRIKNNQITDSTVNAAAKLQDYSITATKLANSLTYGSDLTISGNLTVNGNTTAIDTNVTTIEDPVIVLASTQTGTPAVDIGFLGERGDSTNIAFVWDESADQFVTAFTSDSETNTTITISSYADFKTNNLETVGNLTVGGDFTLTGNVTSLNVTGNLTAGNLISIGDVSGATGSFTGNVDGGNITTAGAVDATGTITGGNISTAGTVTATGNVSGGNITTAGAVDATGTITGGNLSTAGTVTATGNVSGGNLTTAGDVTSATVTATGNVSGGNITTAGAVDATGTITGGNISTAGTVTATGNVSGGNITTAGAVDATGTITGGNISTAGTVTATGNVSGGNLTTAGDVTSATVTATGNVSGGNITTGGIVTATGNVSGGNITTAGEVTATGNVSGGNVVTTALYSASGVTITAASGDIVFSSTGNIDAGNVNILNVAEPVNDTDAANKSYVDSVAQGLDVKQSCLVATANTLANYSGGTISYNNGTDGVGATLTTTGAFTTIDGVSVATAGTRVLVKNETNQAYNGIYQYTNSTTLTRTTDFDNGSPSGEIPGGFTFIEAGSTNADTGWVCTTNAPVTVGTSNIVFTQFSGAGQYTAGDGLTLTGTTFSVNVDNVTIEIAADNLQVPEGASLPNVDIGDGTASSLDVTGNVIAGNVNSNSAITAGTTISATGNVSGGNITTAGAVDATGTITGGNISTAGTVTATGNVSGGNITTAGAVDATGTITGGNISTAGTVTATGNVSGGNLTTAGDVTSATVTATGNVSGGNLTTGGAVDATGTITGGNISTAGTVTATGNVSGGNITTAGAVDATGTITGGNISTAGTVTATGNVSGGNITTAGDVSGATGTFTGNVSGGNIATTGIATLGNIVISGDNITNGASNFISINSAGSDIDLIVSGDNQANLLVVDAGTDTVLIGTGTPTTGASLVIGTTDSFLVPVGNTSQRPATGVSGMVRYNSQTGKLEYYDADSWTTAGADFTVIADEQFNGDGSTVAFTLASSQTTASCIVSINGVVQLPGSAYSVSGTTLTFTEAPLSGDVIDVRQITTTTTVLGLANASGNAAVDASETSATVTVTGDLAVSGIINTNADGVGNIGNATVGFNTIFAKATSAQYADLAEMYEADAAIEPGTVVCFGGTKEVQVCDHEEDTRVAGVVSTNPSYLMNSACEGEHVVAIALTGRVPCRVVGAVRKGDLMVSAGNGAAKAKNDAKNGSVIGKALENFDGVEGTIEVVVGRF